MKLRPGSVRGELGWIVDTRVNGKGTRQFFTKKSDAEKALGDARKQRAAFGKAFDVMPARRKTQIMAALSEIEKAGHSLETLLQLATQAKTLPKASWTLRVAAGETIAAKEALKRSPEYVKGLQLYLDAFIKGRENLSVSSIGVRDIEEWFSARNEKPQTRNSNLGRLSAMFDICWRRRQIEENPCDRIEQASYDKKPPAVFTLRQSQKAFLWSVRQCPDYLAWLTLTHFVGLRPEAEADHIDWPDIDLKKRRIVITKSKVRRHRIIDLKFCPPALAWLTLAKRIGSRLDISVTTRRRYTRKLRAFLKLKRWPQDVLRHTAASNLLAFHQDAGKVAAFLGNSAGVLLRDYKALIFREDAVRFMKLWPKKRHFRRAATHP